MSKLVLPKDSAIVRQFQNLIDSCNMVFFAGLPGVGKSLLLQQCALMATQAGRKVHLLQWDVTRSAFETPTILDKYPEIDGVTHACIRKAVGMWARQGVKQWLENHPTPENILIGEVPLIGNRLIELVQQHDDPTEAILANDKTHFVIPVPSKHVRDVIESSRQQTIASPQHEKESKDAPPNVLQTLWEDCYTTAKGLDAPNCEDTLDYQPHVYQWMYEYLLQHRHTLVLPIDTIFQPAGTVYEVDGVLGELQATPDEVQQIMTQIEADYTLESIEQAVSAWYQV